MQNARTVKHLLASFGNSVIIDHIIAYYGDEDLYDLYDSALTALRSLSYTTSRLTCTVQMLSVDGEEPTPEVQGLVAGEVQPTISLDGVPWSEILGMSVAADPSLSDLDVLTHLIWDRLYGGFDIN
jgi:hypothetical protein